MCFTQVTKEQNEHFINGLGLDTAGTDGLGDILCDLNQLFSVPKVFDGKDAAHDGDDTNPSTCIFDILAQAFLSLFNKAPLTRS